MFWIVLGAFIRRNTIPGLWNGTCLARTGVWAGRELQEQLLSASGRKCGSFSRLGLGARPEISPTDSSKCVHQLEHPEVITMEIIIDWLTDWMVFYATFNSNHGNQKRKLFIKTLKLKGICRWQIEFCWNVGIRPSSKNTVSKVENVVTSIFYYNVFIKCFNPLPDDKFYTLSNWKSLQMTISNLMKREESLPKG